MASSWFERNTVAKMLTNADGDMAKWISIMQDYIAGINTFQDTNAMDKRQIAVGEDAELLKWEMLKTPIPGWKEAIWMPLAVRQMFLELLNPTNILSDNPVGFFYNLNELTKAGRTHTFINNIELHYFEQYGLTQSDVAAVAGSMEYNAIDVQDILDGTDAGTKDYVDLRYPHVVALGTDLLEAYVGQLAVGGTMIITETANYGGLYKSSAIVKHHHLYIPHEWLLAQSNLHVHHMPIDHGYSIVQRVS